MKDHALPHYSRHGVYCGRVYSTYSLGFRLIPDKFRQNEPVILCDTLGTGKPRNCVYTTPAMNRRLRVARDFIPRWRFRVYDTILLVPETLIIPRNSNVSEIMMGLIFQTFFWQGSMHL